MQSVRYISSFFTTPANKTPSRNSHFESYEEFLELQQLLDLLKAKEAELEPYAKEAIKTGIPTLSSVKHETISKLLKAIDDNISDFNEKTCSTFSPETRTKLELQEMNDLIKQLRLTVIKVVQTHHETLAGARNNNKSYTSSALRFGFYSLAAATAAASVVVLPFAVAGAYYANNQAQKVTGLENNEASTIIILRNITVELDKLEKELAAKLNREECNLISKKP